MISLERKETLKDGTGLSIRSLTHDDLDKLMTFYRSLPYEDRKYLRIDVTNRSSVENRIKSAECGQAFRIIALVEEKVAAIGVLELAADDWRKNHGELRVVVSRKFQRKGLGMIMIRELYLLAVQHKVEKVVAKMMRPQLAARKIFRKLGFREELFLPDYVRDQDKQDQDLVIMICDTKDLWNELEFFYNNSDWMRCR